MNNKNTITVSNAQGNTLAHTHTYKWFLGTLINGHVVDRPRFHAVRSIRTPKKHATVLRCVSGVCVCVCPRHRTAVGARRGHTQTLASAFHASASRMKLRRLDAALFMRACARETTLSRFGRRAGYECVCERVRECVGTHAIAGQTRRNKAKTRRAQRVRAHNRSTRSRHARMHVILRPGRLLFWRCACSVKCNDWNQTHGHACVCMCECVCMCVSTMAMAKSVIFKSARQSRGVDIFVNDLSSSETITRAAVLLVFAEHKNRHTRMLARISATRACVRACAHGVRCQTITQPVTRQHFGFDARER